MILEQQFLELIESELKEKGWSRADLARAMNATPQYVTNYLNGRRSPGADVMERFFRALGCTPRLVVEQKSARKLVSAS